MVLYIYIYKHIAIRIVIVMNYYSNLNVPMMVILLLECESTCRNPSARGFGLELCGSFERDPTRWCRLPLEGSKLWIKNHGESHMVLAPNSLPSGQISYFGYGNSPFINHCPGDPCIGLCCYAGGCS